MMLTSDCLQHFISNNSVWYNMTDSIVYNEPKFKGHGPLAVQFPQWSPKVPYCVTFIYTQLANVTYPE